MVGQWLWSIYWAKKRFKLSVAPCPSFKEGGRNKAMRCNKRYETHRIHSVAFSFTRYSLQPSCRGLTEETLRVGQ